MPSPTLAAKGPAMRIGGILRRLGTALLFLIILLLLAPVVVPPFLDRIYYRGPISVHYDGKRFANQDGDAFSPQQMQPVRMLRFFSGQARAAWPDHVAVTPGHPVPRVEGTGMTATWIGHSTVLVQAGGINILTDPVYAERAGPWGILGPRRVREPGVRFDDLPKIDLILVSHDHYDHMDVPTLKRLWARDHPMIVTSLGNDSVIGLPAATRDWGGKVEVRPGITVTIERVHHWGSRWMADRDRALWSGFSVTLPGGNLFFAGDTGWGDGSWPIAAAKDGPYRLAILPIGAFVPRDLMASNHIGPVEAVDAFRRLGASYGLAVHWGTFRLSSEAIGDPPALLRATVAKRGISPERFRALEVGQPWSVPALH
ncbi:L-ascorbate metabolism protein UlaG (beta-lactamase superfamily) [Sphingomonas vulcanisoli]|uniref:L-ascorbate metabolism protein UlaG (Beta-lactamase superfamily) n=1 Tax=Sphingomonas vulcanisoli TaxID=1658060 RepID=A0ABX0TWZ7_9SPHN|nr:MBL fold metallo-hydrolase [Sphingomonas vulcanisoli]NIJ08305.1 L-ascorbate metabolism protein UlaG (beta-lactamase superfamily) [Sphingomonas vulcanisoli]